jgi:hypothetical protein
MITHPDLSVIENELKKRLAYPYTWGRRQSDRFDQATRFIYSTFSFDELLRESEKRFNQQEEGKEYLNYALNRWYNFWSAVAVERIFCALPGVQSAVNPRDRLVDFTIGGITFDHKTSVFPKNFSQSQATSQKDPRSLIQWLYDNQSQEGRRHFGNRLFIVLHASDGQHWKLKAEVGLLRQAIEQYMATFTPNQLHSFCLQAKAPTLSDIIWVTR